MFAIVTEGAWILTHIYYVVVLVNSSTDVTNSANETSQMICKSINSSLDPVLRRQGKSTSTVLIQLVENILDRLEEGCAVTSLFMNSINLAVQSENWFLSYLSGRKQRVELLHAAGDTTKGSTLNYSKLSHLQKKENWLLTTNSDAAINLIKENCDPHDLILNDTKATPASCGKHKWTSCARRSVQALALFGLKQISISEATRTAYFAFLEPHLRYDIATWGGATAKNLERVLTIQRESCRKAFFELKILTLLTLYIQKATQKLRHRDIYNIR
ncbi:hypothetical protein J6590_041607 [Homalodisca vitripennis]|nr:hypothetical protein J6590_041607 [Homalodisca vitripennis]